MRKTLILTLSLCGMLQASSHADLLVTFPHAGVLRFSETSGSFVTNFAYPFVESIWGGVFGPDGCFYVTANTLGYGAVIRYDGTTGALSKYFVPFGGSNDGLTTPTALKFGPDGNLYVTSWSRRRILRYHGATGAFLDAFVPDGRGGLAEPQDLVFGPDDNLYVSDSLRGVLRYNGLTGAFLGTFVSEGSGGLDFAYRLTFGPDGNLYVSSLGNDAVLRFNGTNGAFIDSFVSSGSGGLHGPLGLAFGPDRNLYVCSAGNRAVLRFSGMTGTFMDTIVPPGSVAGSDVPSFLTFTRPKLQILKSSTGLQLSWPAVVSNYVLEARAGLAGAQWNAVTQSSSVLNNEIILTNSPGNGPRFFRLRAP